MIQMKKAKKDAMMLSGMMTRTNNQREFEGNGNIQKLWEQFYAQDTNENQRNQSQPIYAIYSDYESEEFGHYNYTISTECSRFPLTNFTMHIPKQNYIVFTTEKGPIAEVVPNAWEEIWNWSKTSAEKRSFTYDMEVYDERAQDPANAIVDIYIAIV
ncbi:GyrI-like domain-containing protein [Longirhabdus pacifica]|uniref:GyrI-like domain-containing protein n=1 Tax=Longirhabdus pacifica TaxID=2305227 RepID=UPI001008E65C|nr:GyrI-like domain-containing protein [Longirhabdus pacifica]